MLKLIQLMKFKTKNFASMPKQSIEDGGKAVLLVYGARCDPSVVYDALEGAPA